MKTALVAMTLAVLWITYTYYTITAATTTFTW